MIGFNENNLLMATDAYKLNHWRQYPEGTTGVYSYMESRPGAAHPYVVTFGLQYVLKKFLIPSYSWDDLSEAGEVAHNIFGDGSKFPYRQFADLLGNHAGRLPLRIKAVPEGMQIPTGNVLMTIENTDPDYYWLTNYMESLLLHTWYPTSVATRSKGVKDMIGYYLRETSTLPNDVIQTVLRFMLHDFGYRGVSSQESAGVGGMAHLVNFMGTDTMPALLYAKKFYGASYEGLAASVPATEHSIMTSRGEDGELQIVSDLLDLYTNGILSLVADSYSIYRFVKAIGNQFKERVLARDGVLVIRPDSVTAEHRTPADLVVWILDQLWHDFGGETNSKGFKVLDPHVRVLWGDGIEPDGIELILKAMTLHSYSTENIATFGMGGGLLQKLNRDTENFSIKSSAQERDGVWRDISKNALGKKSKAGKLQLSVDCNGKFETLPLGSHHDHLDTMNVLETVFEDGRLVKEYTFDEIRANADRKV